LEQLGELHRRSGGALDQRGNPEGPERIARQGPSFGRYRPPRLRP
jgi:hypothetical protein